MREKVSLLRYGAASSTFIAGILHLSLVANSIDRTLIQFTILNRRTGSNILGYSYYERME